MPNETEDWLPQPSCIKEWLTFHGLRLQTTLAGSPLLNTHDLDLTSIVGVLIEYVERLEARVAELEVHMEAK